MEKDDTGRDVESTESKEEVIEPKKTIETTESSKSTPDKDPAKQRRSKMLLAIAVVVALLAAGGIYWYYDQTMRQLDKTTDQSTVTTPAKKNASSDLEMQKFLNPTTGEKWYDTPKVLANQQYLKRDVELLAGQEASKYREIGTRGDSKIILVIDDGGISSNIYLFEKAPDGRVVSIGNYHNGSKSISDEEKRLLQQNINQKIVTVIDETIHYDSLSVPSTIVLDNGEKLTRAATTLGSADYINKDVSKKLKDIGTAAIYTIEFQQKDVKLTTVHHFMKIQPGFTVDLNYDPISRKLDNYTWNDGKKLTFVDKDGTVKPDTVKPISQGCGGITYSIVSRADAVTDADLVQVGTSDGKKPIYQFKEKTQTILKKAYDEYVTAMGIYEKPVLPLDAFIDTHGVIVTKSADNAYLVYIRNSYSLPSQCAKPVVYLYPTTTMNVNVAVAADVKVSEPLYPAGGWKNVTATPSGALTYQGKAYDSLFWEGPGHGVYPGITSGTVVARAQAEATIERQLAEQGLNAKESADFMEFWRSRIPNKPFIRLTWLTTAEMNRLAPLQISPRPDTVFRVFLDMAGYDQPVDLPVQKLERLERRGFTVVEWGGLAMLAP